MDLFSYNEHVVNYSIQEENMPAVEPLYLLLERDLSNGATEKLLLLEAKLFLHICEALAEYFQNLLTDVNLMSFIIRDILATGEYTISGIAIYTHTPEHVIIALLNGYKNNPKFFLTRKIIELHRMVRVELYGEIMNKIKSCIN